MSNEIIINETCDEKEFIIKTKEAIGLKPIDIKFKKLDERAVIPTYAHDGDVGMDLTAIDVEYDEEKDLYIYHTGLAFESDKHYGQLLFPRSSNRKTDAYLCNSVGIADSAIYRGEIMICYKNRDSISLMAEVEGLKAYISTLSVALSENVNSSEIASVSLEMYNFSKEKCIEKAKNLEFAPYKVGDKVAQMVFVSYPNVNLIEQEELTDTERGANGFGSTGN
ncbi:MAG: hypothetical protein IKT40_01535 [Bacilli bacterium]|nr:hypothetical protein [Bacilli bacterium]